MNAQQIFKIINKINLSGSLKPDFGMLPENKGLLDEIYGLAKQIKPCNKYWEDRKLWVWADKGTYEEFLDTFGSLFTKVTWKDLFDSIETHGGGFSINHETLNKNGRIDHDEMKEKWAKYFPDDIVWFQLYLNEVNDSRGLLRGLFLNSMFGNQLIIDTEKNHLRHRKIDMTPLLEWIIEAEKKCIEMIKQGTYNDFIAQYLPYEYRSGVTKLTTYWKYVPEDRERLFGKIDPDELKQFQAWNKDEDVGWKQMTANDYFRICDSLYDLLGYKEKHPIGRNDGSDEPITPKEYFMMYAWATHYHTTQKLLEINGDSAEAFKELVVSKYTDQHTWDAGMSHDVLLKPKLIGNKFYIDLYFDHKITEYEQLIHLLIELRKQGFPVLKRTDTEELMSGNDLISIVPSCDSFDNKYEELLGLSTNDSRYLSAKRCNELIKEILWLPTEEFSIIDKEDKTSSTEHRCKYDLYDQCHFHKEPKSCPDKEDVLKCITAVVMLYMKFKNKPLNITYSVPERSGEGICALSINIEDRITVFVRMDKHGRMRPFIASALFEDSPESEEVILQSDILAEPSVCGTWAFSQLSPDTKWEIITKSKEVLDNKRNF